MLEVNLVAKKRAGGRVGAQGVEGGGYDGGGGFLVVEDGNGADGDDGEKEGQGTAPVGADGFDVYKRLSV